MIRQILADTKCHWLKLGSSSKLDKTNHSSIVSINMPWKKSKPIVSLMILLSFPSLAWEPQDDAFKIETPDTATKPAFTPGGKDVEFSNDFEWLDDFYDSFSDALDESALWLNDHFVDDCSDPTRNGSKAWARVMMGWEPRAGDWSTFPLKFKVKVNLPNLKQKVNLVFSDNEEEDFNRLPLETSRPGTDSLDKRDFSAAIQLLHKSNEHAYFRSRLGIGSAQIYARSSYRWKKKLDDDWVVSVEPSLEYYMNDGLGYRFLTQMSYFPNKNSEFRAFYSIWDREEFSTPHWKKALYHLTRFNYKSTLITGILVNGVTEPNYRDEKITLSTRWRRHALRKWLFFEVEPFIDFERQNDYDTTWGIALRVGGYFGYAHD